MKKILLSAIFLLTAISLYAENPRYKISVTHGGAPLGDIVIELYADVAPLHTRQVDSLVSVGFYNTTAFHRVLPGSIIQGGGINSRTDMQMPRETWGYSDPSQTTVNAEFSQTLKHLRGTISGARTPDSNSFTSQFFICVKARPDLDKNYSIFGEVVSGMDIVDKIVAVPRDLSGATKDNPKQKVEMTIIKLLPSDVKDFCPGASPLLLKTFPNPAEYFSKINFTLPKPMNAKLEIVNSAGENVTTLHNGELPEGAQEFIWDARSNSNGNYFYRLETTSGIETGKIVLLKK